MKLLLLLTILFAGIASAQKPQLVDDHTTDSLDRFDSMRIALVTITYFDGKRIEAVTVAQDGTRSYIFDTDKNSKLEWPTGYKPKEHKTDLFWVVYCSKNHSRTPDEKSFYAYVLTQALPTQIKK